MIMGVRSAGIILWTIASSVFGQTYTICTLAGGTALVNVPGTSANLVPQYIATDSAGNVFSWMCCK